MEDLYIFSEVDSEKAFAIWVKDWESNGKDGKQPSDTEYEYMLGS